MAHVHRKDLEDALFAADYPATRDQLLELAERHLGRDDVVSAVASLPPVAYRTFDEVLQSVKPVVDTAVRPEPDRDGPRTVLDEAMEENARRSG